MTDAGFARRYAAWSLDAAGIAAIATLVLGLLFASAVIVVLVGAAYLAWRDTFAGGAAVATVPPGPPGIEA